MVVDPISLESNFEVTDGVKSDEGIERGYGTCLMAVEIEDNNVHPVDELPPDTIENLVTTQWMLTFHYHFPLTRCRIIAKVAVL